MKTRISALLALVLAVAPALAGGEPEGLAISAFADLQLPVEADVETGGSFRVNQAEIDLEGRIHPRTTAAMALAYDPELETFALAVLSAEYQLAEGDGLRAALTCGQFDVRFGVDWRVYASIDRRLITPPLIIDGTHEGWNDLGANLELGLGPLTADLFLVNGAHCGRGVQTAKVDRAEIRRAVGGRLGLVSGAVEVGSSGAVFRDVAGGTAMALWGLDLQAYLGALVLRGEYVYQDVDNCTPYSSHTHGWYVQALRDFGPGYGFVRWDGIEPDAAEAAKPRRWSLGGGWLLGDGHEIRLEHEVGDRALPNRTWLQVAFSFGELGG